MGLVKVKVMVLVPPLVIVLGAKLLVMLGNEFTVKVSLPPAALLGASLVPSTLVVLTPVAVAVTFDGDGTTATGRDIRGVEIKAATAGRRGIGDTGTRPADHQPGGIDHAGRGRYR